MEPTTPLLTLLHFNDAYDLHARNDPTTFLKFYDLLLHLRKQANCLFFFSGDTVGPSKLSTIFHGMQMAAALNMLGITAACLGNHDFDYGLEHLIKFKRHCNFPWLLGNVKIKGSGTNLGESLNELIIEKNGIKIGIFGAVGNQFRNLIKKKIDLKSPTATCFPPTLSEKYLHPIQIDQTELYSIDTYKYCEQISQELRSQGCDLVIAVTHMHNQQDLQIAGLHNIDFILGGHDHCILHAAQKGVVVKSGEDFEGMTAISIWERDTMASEGEGWHNGIRWQSYSKFHPICAVPQGLHPEVWEFLSSLKQQIESHFKRKMVVNNRPHTKINLPEPSHLFTYRLLHNRIMLQVNSSLPADSLFAKCIAMRRHYIPFISYELRQFPIISVREVLEWVVNQVSDSGDLLFSAVFFGPYSPIVQYCCGLANWLYLPSEIYYNTEILPTEDVCCHISGNCLSLDSIPEVYNELIEKCNLSQRLLTMDGKNGSIRLNSGRDGEICLRLAEDFMRMNKIEPLGVVVNQEPIRNCLFETYFGYLPSSANLDQLCKYPKVWINLWADQFGHDWKKMQKIVESLQKIQSKQKNSQAMELIVIRMDPQGTKLGSYLAKHSPKIYPVQYLPYQHVLQLLDDFHPAL